MGFGFRVVSLDLRIGVLEFRADEACCCPTVVGHLRGPNRMLQFDDLHSLNTAFGYIIIPVYETGLIRVVLQYFSPEAWHSMNECSTYTEASAAETRRVRLGC